MRQVLPPSAYRARETIEPARWERFAWFDKYVNWNAVDGSELTSGAARRTLRLDRDKPGSDDGTLRPPPAATCWRRRSGGVRWRSGTAFG